MLLVLNMIDLARRRGIVFDLDRLSSELGIAVVTAVSVRKGGTADLLAHLDALAPESGQGNGQGSAHVGANLWRPHSAGELRALQREADRIIAATVTAAGQTRHRNDTDRFLGAAPLGRTADPPDRPVVMFQRCSVGHSRQWNCCRARSPRSASVVHDELPAAAAKFLQNGVISGVAA